MCQNVVNRNTFHQLWAKYENENGVKCSWQRHKEKQNTEHSHLFCNHRRLRVEFFRHLTPVFGLHLHFLSRTLIMFIVVWPLSFSSFSPSFLCASFEESRSSSLLLLKCKSKEKMKIFFYSHFLCGFHYHHKNLCAVNCMYCILLC